MKRLFWLSLMVCSMTLVAAAPGLPPTPDPYPGPTSYPGPATSTPAPSPNPRADPDTCATEYVGLQPMFADGCDDCQSSGPDCGRAVAIAGAFRCGRVFGCHVQTKEPMNAPLYSPPRPKTKPTPHMPEPVMTKEEWERLERQLIPTINTIRTALGKPPIIVPKG